MVEVGGKAIKTWPLNTDQNIICLIFGSFELLWGLLIKFVPTKYFTCITMDDSPAEDEADTMVSRLKATSRHNKSSKCKKIESDVGGALLAQVKARQASLQN